MKTFSKFFYLLFLILFASCKKDVVAPNDEANGRNILYVEIDDKKYLLRENCKLLNKRQYAEFSSYDGLYSNPRIISINQDTILFGYKLYNFQFDIQNDKKENFFGGFELYYWFKDIYSPILIKKANSNLRINNEFISISNIDFFNIKGFAEKREKRNLYKLNFELQFNFKFNNNIINHRCFWKGDILINKI